LSDFYSYRLIGKLTAFLQLQEFSLRNLPVASSTSAARLSLKRSKAGLVWLSLRRQLINSMGAVYESRKEKNGMGAVYESLALSIYNKQQ
jgi:hypothetical protein